LPSETATPTPIPVPTYEEKRTWSRFAFENEKVRDIEFDPSDFNILYVSLAEKGLYKSPDGGKTWTEINTGMPKDVMDITIDNSNPLTLYAGTYYGFYKSTDGGVNWVSSVRLGRINVSVITIDPKSPDTIYIGTMDNKGVFKSTDGGDRWVEMNYGLVSEEENPYFTVYDLVLDPSDSNIIYAATFAGVYKSLDGGENWAVINSGLMVEVSKELRPDSIFDLVMDPQNPKILYASGSLNGVYKSTDGGDTWVEKTQSIFKNFFDHEYGTIWPSRSILLDPSSSDIVYLGNYGGGVFMSRNGGDNWIELNSGLTNPNVTVLILDPSSPARLLAGTAEGFGNKDNNFVGTAVGGIFVFQE
jgi:photosystem II stability/assembly factor-like uncharacterized protein